jgi:hypothetical protein
MVELPYGVVATSCDYIFENYEDAKICADSLMTRKVRPQERERRVIVGWSHIGLIRL